MADNVQLPATGTGTADPTVATDDISGVHYQKVKLFDGTADSTTILGTTAHDAADAGNAIKIGAKAVDQLDGVTLVATGDKTDLYADLDGVQVVKPHTTNADILNERVSNTNGTSTDLTTFGATASARNHITSIIIYNDSTTNGFVDIRDGAAGAVLMTLPAPGKGGSIWNAAICPLRQPTANTALAFDVSAALSTVYLTFIGFKSKA
jgi:hypothetical protein